MEKPLPPKLATRLNQGLESHRAGDLQAALKAYDSVLKKKPLNADALWLKGSVFVGLGDGPSAVAWLTKAVKRRPADAAITNDLGMAYESCGDIEAARDAFKKAQGLDPEEPSVRVNIARYALADGQADVALHEADEAIKTQPYLVEAHNTRGLALVTLGREEDGLTAFAAALEQSPNDVGVLFNKGDLLRKRGAFENGQLALRRVADLAGPGSDDWAKAMMSLGLIHVELGQYTDAMTCYNSVLGQCPGHVDTLTNRADLRYLLGDLVSAEQDNTLALGLDGDNATARSNQAFIHLARRNWGVGWDDNEARWLVDEPTSIRRDRGIPAWDGVSSEKTSLFVWGEQGLGDQILFSTQVADLVASGVHPTLEVDRRLAPLLQRSFPDLTVFAYDEISVEGLRVFDGQIAMGSLGRFLRRSAESFPEPKAFLKQDAELTEQLRRKYLEGATGKPVIGLAWNSINPRTGSRKSLPLAEWGSILTMTDAHFVSLQYGEVDAAIEAAKIATGVHIKVDADVNPMADFDAAAAQVAAMDLVIATSNTAVHLAGALGKTVWVMIPAVPDWRWGLEGDTAPWYPNLRLFRQKEQGDWGPVIREVSTALEQWCAAN